MLEDYHLVKHRRNGSTIYRCKHYTHYMKVGPKDEIEKEIQLYQKLKAVGIPLPTLLGYESQEDDLGWMKEEVIKGLLYAELFSNSYEESGKVSDELLEKFIAYQQNHLRGQAKTIGNKDIVAEGFSKYNHLYSEGLIEPSLINAVLKKINIDLANQQQGRNHGDHNAYNIFEEGVIDLEDSFYGALGYDTITAITQNFWFPYSGKETAELSRQHSFSQDQLMHYLKSLSTNSIGIDFTNSDQFAALFLMRGIFVTVQSDSMPLWKAYKYKRLQAAMQAYIDGKNMVEYFLENY